MDIVKTFCERMREELHDVIAYGELYEKLKADGHHEEAEMIEEIARDEYTHAKAFCVQLRHHHHVMDDEMRELWHKADAAFEED
jgi:hypothetical protein